MMARVANGEVPLLYHFCRLQLPAAQLSSAAFDTHLRRMFGIFKRKMANAEWASFLNQVHPVDAFLASACLEGSTPAWEALFAARTGRSDQLLVDALRARAIRLYPQNLEKQESAVADFWGHLLVAESAGSVPILARYDGQRPLIPWLIRIFHNWHISLLRGHNQRSEGLAEDDFLADPRVRTEADGRWEDAFCEAARAWLKDVGDEDALLLGLRLRYRLSQREVAKLLGLHEGGISRKIDKLRERCLEKVGERLQADGWTGDDISGFIYREMAGVLLDDARLSANRLASLLAARGKVLPASAAESE